MENLPIDTKSLPSRIFYSEEEGKIYVGEPGDYKEVGSGGSTSADQVTYDNTDSGLLAENVQEAVDEVQGNVEQLNTTIASSGIIETATDYILNQIDSGKTVFLTSVNATVTVPTSGLTAGFFVNIKFKNTGGKIIDLSETLNGDNEGFNNGTPHNYDVPKNGVLIFTRMNNGTLDVTGDII